MVRKVPFPREVNSPLPSFTSGSSKEIKLGGLVSGYSGRARWLHRESTGCGQYVTQVCSVIRFRSIARSPEVNVDVTHKVVSAARTFYGVGQASYDVPGNVGGT